jgi:hypothetical protein
VVSSIEPHQLNVQEVRNDGPRLLKKYLEFAREVSAGNFVYEPQQDDQRASSWYLSSLVMNSEIGESNSFDTNSLPYADLVVRKTNIKKGLLLTDDSTFYSCLSVKDPYVNIPLLFHQKNWKYLRIYSRKWWADRAKSLAAISEFIKSCEAV